MLWFVVVVGLVDVVRCNWENWWTYDGISGPAYWGLINPAWTMCNKGRRQSPIDLDPAFLNYDCKLENMSVDKQSVSARITNTGQSLVLRVEDGQLAINITGGPLAYKYQFQEMYFHWGEPGRPGAEHTVNHQQFPAEIQIYGFNTQLYSNLTVAREFPGGVVAISVLVKIKDSPLKKETSLAQIISHLPEVTYRGGSSRVGFISLADILPRTDDFITYEGSTTFPGCWETVTWIVFNKPVYISQHDIDAFRRLKQGDRHHEKAPLGNNLRPQQPLNNRALRTNIALPAQKDVQGECSDPSTLLTYQQNSWLNTVVSPAN
ncbi:putative carbonic anhydrase-like protein 1 [Eurytemora carolleeae]|uniref:putative carbonic anhydrase-like protein 1 n=1 Tax=Eurytemora carolleeae TaxID=1294199 RepID=UPI000C76F214|nr:putative carbonic anhydrase-like protein 1 [Eurytemora carolleeae]XP_023322038.1 putative carbonic anhydrase-like protein 1 [Eurytemora carolleeae]XP_023322039.1 putative carbonic anhydrase-like protein 1 [Eurytemora carolleeae]|eukprot:XP_023322037.1 putative carbonic anhydrase-like protein 1 [Eurytemora affinis]